VKNGKRGERVDREHQARFRGVVQADAYPNEARKREQSCQCMSQRRADSSDPSRCRQRRRAR
jgi:hypothetical protein